MNVEVNEGGRRRRRAGESSVTLVDLHQCFHTAQEINAKTYWLLQEITNFCSLWLQGDMNMK